MRKLLIALTAAACLLLALPAAAFAEPYEGGGGWSVTFTADKQMQSTFDSTSYADTLRGLQPGDDVTLKVSLVNSYGSTTDWYMTNEILSSLEDTAGTSASGGAYSYRLAYTGPDGSERVFFDSDTVGGDSAGSGTGGLNEVSSALADYFYLGAIGSGQSGTVTLRIALDGETQGNGYMSTLADLKMNFAVETPDEATTPPPTTPQNPSTSKSSNAPKTGDGVDMMPLVAIAAGSLALVVLAAVALRRRKDEQKGSLR